MQVLLRLHSHQAGNESAVLGVDVDFCDFNDSFGGVFKEGVFEVGPRERMKELMGFYLEEFKGRIDPR